MQCPRDGETLEAREIAGHPVPTCSSCGGMFLVAGALNEVAAPIPGDLELSTLELDPREHADEFGPTACPSCSALMEKVDFIEAGELVLDHCPACGGFWLDGHELERIDDEIRRLNETAAEVHDPPWLFLVRLLSGITR